MTNFELNENELDKVVGGTLDEAAKAWVERNKTEVIRRAGALGGLANMALNYVNNCEELYDVPALKKAIKGYGINVDDLN